MKRSKLSNRTSLIALVVLLIVVVGFYALNHRSNKGSGTIPSTNTASTTASSPIKSATAAVAPNDSSTSAKYTAPAAANSSVLVTPTGTFVSNHRPSLSGPSEQKAEQSTCNTTPGATCSIELTKGSVTKTLKTQTADKSGAVYWSWNVEDAGLTEGTWKVTAIASLNNNTKTAQDEIDLVVQP